VATLTRLTGDLGVAEDAVQDACEAAPVVWGEQGLPGNPRAWLIGTARHKAVDRLRRDARRPDKETAAMRDLAGRNGPEFLPSDEDDLALLFMCCHPALERGARIALTLRCVCGLSTAEIAAGFLVPEPTMAKRLVRAKQKIRQAGIPCRTPSAEDLPNRLADVLRVVYLVFTEGHMASTGPDLVRDELCETAIDLARAIIDRLPDNPEAEGLLGLLLLTDARRPARTSADGELVLLEDQDRTLWDRAKITEGEALLERALRRGRPGPYQLWAAIAACHSTAPSAAETDWRQIAALYGELIRYEPTATVEANRAIAVAMAEGPAAGLVILDTIALNPTLERWPHLHTARADLLRRLGRHDDAVDAYRTALELEPSAAERSFIATRIQQLTRR
jgi:RNA polymerase sigma-70 factor, ECF subfamily